MLSLQTHLAIKEMANMLITYSESKSGRVSNHPNFHWFPYNKKSISDRMKSLVRR